MALAATVAVAGWFASPLISKLLDHRILNWKEKKELKKGLEEETKSLHGVLSKIKGIVEVAEEKQFEKEDVRGWLSELKDVLYDAEDVLDMYEADLLLKKQRDTELLSKEEVRISFTSLLSSKKSKDSAPSSSRLSVAKEIKRAPSKKKLRISFISLLSSKKSKDGAPSSSRLSVAKEIKRIRERLDKILKQGINFGLVAMVRSAPQDDPRLFQKRKTTSYPGDDESTFVGRDDVKKEMIDHLVPDIEGRVHPVDGEKRFLVLPIVGMGGLGKTTLAQLVFNDKKVVAFYKSRAWVCVGESTRDLGLEKTTASIIDSMRSFAGEKKACKFKDLQSLQTTLAGEIQEPFLLVVDDAWDADSNTWAKLLAPLKATKKRCRVIVTTRDEKVAYAFSDSLHVRRLSFLDGTSMWRIFEKSAFSNQNAMESSSLEPVGKRIVARLKGLPLAAKIIGGILRGNKNIHDWRKILKSKQLLNNNNQEEDFMRSILMLSYNHLPMNMKQYFSCFSLFPKDYAFCEYAYRNIYKDSIWMIERVLFLIEAGLSSKDMTYDYVDGLLSRSLLHSEYRISMHDLVHDMAELIGKEEFLRISDTHQIKPIPEKIRYVSFFQEIFDPNSAILESLTNYMSLRTLLYSNTNERLKNPHGLLDGWFRNLKYLRVLTLYNKWILELPDSIKNLRLLIYLDLFLPNIKKIPATIHELCKLKGLNLRGCDNLCELPNCITRLVNLIHLDVNPKLLCKVDRIGKLTNLQELEEFYVEEEEGHLITELENMNELCGSLSIRGLDRVKTRENAQQARLDEKTKLESLNLAWCDDIGDGEQQVNIIEGLRPCTDLKKLSIHRFQGTRLPDWLAGSSLISLHRLEVTGCHNLVDISSLPSTLRSLELSNRGVKSLFSSTSTVCLPSLQSLEVIVCSELDESLNVLLKASSLSLKYLTISEYNCPLEGLSYLTNLHELDLHDCKEKVILNPTALISLRKMKIDNCPNVFVQGHCSDSELCGSSLISLVISNSPMLLESVSQCSDLHMDSLNDHHISSECDALTLSKCLCNATALERLNLSSCINITSLPSELMHKLAAIKNLEIYHCPNLVKLEFPPVADINITIWECPNLLFRRSSPLVKTVINRLVITGSGGEQLSGLFSIFQNTPIQGIELHNCIITDATATSMLGGICRNTTLEVLEIDDCGGVSSQHLSKGLDSSEAHRCSWEFPSLESLTALSILKCSANLAFTCGESTTPLKSLRKLNIITCSAITSLPVLSSLVDLSIDHCSNLAFTWQEASTPFFPSLEYLRAVGFSGKQLIDLMKRLIKSPIKRIAISDCIELQSFDGDLLYPLLAFKNSLEQLQIKDCPNLRCLPTHLEVFEALRELTIHKCPEMSTLPDGLPPTSLYTLIVEDCPALEVLYKDGNQWLYNIPEVIFRSSP